MLNFYVYPEKLTHFYGVESWYMTVEGPTKPRWNIWNRENVSVGFSKWGMEYAMFNFDECSYKGYQI
jgi:hypothetical protein